MGILAFGIAMASLIFAMLRFISMRDEEMKSEKWQNNNQWQ